MRTMARILSMTKDNEQYCSSRCILAVLQDEFTNELFHVEWAESPGVIGFPGTQRSMAQDMFEKTWNNCNVGDLAWLHQCNETGFNFFEPFVEAQAV